MQEELKQKILNYNFPFTVDDKLLAKSDKFLEELKSKDVWKSIDLTILGEPKAWVRHRARTIGVKTGGGEVVRQFAGMYDPNCSFKHIISDYFRDVMAEKDIQLIYGPVKLSIDFYKRMPKSIPPYKAILYEMKELAPLSTPDVDNYIKQIQDAINAVVFYDDKQIILERSAKYLSFNPRMEIHMEYIEKDNWK